MISFKHKGDFKPTRNFLANARATRIRNALDKYGQLGVNALADATPKDTGTTAASWDYTVSITKSGCSITWTNSNSSDGIPIVVLLQYGHATRNGGYVKGVDFINPTMKPVFNEILYRVWGEVINA